MLRQRRLAELNGIGQLADRESRGRVRTRLVDVTDTDAVVKALDEDTALLWLESPTNPGMEVADLPALIAEASLTDRVQRGFRSRQRCR